MAKFAVQEAATCRWASICALPTGQLQQNMMCQLSSSHTTGIPVPPVWGREWEAGQAGLQAGAVHATKPELSLPWSIGRVQNAVSFVIFHREVEHCGVSVLVESIIVLSQAEPIARARVCYRTRIDMGTRGVGRAVWHTPPHRVPLLSHWQ